MSKAILVIDIPKKCYECPLMSNDMYCKAYAYIVKGRKLCVEDDVLHGERNSVCPLKPFNENALKSGNKEYLIYQRDWLYKNLDREIEMLKSGKKYFDEILGETE